MEFIVLYFPSLESGVPLVNTMSRSDIRGAQRLSLLGVGEPCHVWRHSLLGPRSDRVKTKTPGQASWSSARAQQARPGHSVQGLQLQH